MIDTIENTDWDFSYLLKDKHTTITPDGAFIIKDTRFGFGQPIKVYRLLDWISMNAELDHIKLLVTAIPDNKNYWNFKSTYDIQTIKVDDPKTKSFHLVPKKVFRCLPPLYAKDATKNFPFCRIGYALCDLISHSGGFGILICAESDLISVAKRWIRDSITETELLKYGSDHHQVPLLRTAE